MDGLIAAVQQRHIDCKLLLVVARTKQVFQHLLLLHAMEFSTCYCHMQWSSAPVTVTRNGGSTAQQHEVVASPWQQNLLWFYWPHS